MDTLAPYEKASYSDLAQLFRGLNNLIEILVEIFYKLQLDQTPVDAKSIDLKEYKKCI